MSQIPPGVTGLSHTSRKCTECRRELTGEKEFTCSPKCRKRRERRIKDAHSVHVLIEQDLFKMRESIKRGENLEDFRKQLIWLKTEINDLLMLAKDPDTMARHEMIEARARKS